MALTDENNGNGFYMPVAPAYMGGNQGGFGGFGGDSWGWIILLLLIAGNGGWGMGAGGFGGYGNMQLGMDFPWLLNGQNGINNNVSSGFRDAQISDGITSIRDGISGLSTQMCNGFSGVNAGVANGFAQAEIAANGRQMANMNQAFGAQTAMLQGFNQIGSQLAECCCENRLASCQTQNLVQNEGNATRFADANNTRDILTAMNAGIQSIKDQLCQDKIDAKNETIANLRQELMFSRGQASQVEQTAQLLANNNAQTAIFQQGMNAEVDALYNRLNNCPVPTTPVYGRTPIFNCNNNGCGCGCNG